MNSALALSPGEVHAWCLDLQLNDLEWQEAQTVLARQEWERYQLKRPDLARTAVASRYYCRLLLSRYLNIPPQFIDIQYGPHGKPWVKSPQHLEFNVTHKDQKAMMVFALSPIGVDLEKTKPRSFLNLAKRYFATSERQVLLAQPENARAETFYRIWTQKEAFIKTFGKSIFSDLSRFTVNPKPPGGLLTWRDGDLKEWICRSWALESNYWWALMTRSPVHSVLLRMGFNGEPLECLT